MKLRFSSHHFVVAILALLAANAYAYDFKSDGIYYNVSSEKNRTVEVTSGGYRIYRGNIVIPDRVLNDGRTYTVTSIGERAFSDCDALTSVEFPSSLTSIGERAFFDCDYLTSVDLSSTSLTSIGERAFSGCGALTNVDLSSTSLTSISEYAFYECKALANVDLSSTSLTFIGSWAFYYCKALTNVKFPASLTTIESYAFS